MTENIDLRHVQAFLAVAQTLHFGRAAKTLGVSQPALSRTIGWLEAELDAPLFDRTTRNVALTPVGRLLAEKAPETIAAFKRLVDEVSRAATGETGHVSVGYMDFAINGPLPVLLKRFREKEPSVGVDLTYQPTTHQRTALLDRSLDIGFLIGPLHHPAIATAPVEAAPLVVLLPRGHRLAKHKRIAPALLADEAWVLGAAEPWRAFREVIEDVCAEHGFAPRIAQEASTSDGILGLVAAGIGISLYSNCAKNLKRNGVVIRNLSAPAMVETVAAWHRSNTNPALKRFLEALDQ